MFIHIAFVCASPDMSDLSKQIYLWLFRYFFLHDPRTPQEIVEKHKQTDSEKTTEYVIPLKTN